MGSHESLQVNPTKIDDFQPVAEQMQFVSFLLEKSYPRISANLYRIALIHGQSFSQCVQSQTGNPITKSTHEHKLTTQLIDITTNKLT